MMTTRTLLSPDGAPAIELRYGTEVELWDIIERFKRPDAPTRRYFDVKTWTRYDTGHLAAAAIEASSGKWHCWYEEAA